MRHSDERHGSSAVEVILFDAVGTLLEPDPPVAVAYERAGRTFGSTLAVEEVRRRFGVAFARQEQLDDPRCRHAPSAGESREIERWRTIVAEVFDDVRDHEPLFQALWEHFARPEHWRLNADVPQVWAELSARGFQLGVASNFDVRLESICRGIPPLDRCSRLFVASRLAAHKPNLAFFRQIEAALGVTPSQIVLVGDDARNDYYGALAAGWSAVLFDPRRQATAERRISRLSELLSLEMQPLD